MNVIIRVQLPSFIFPFILLQKSVFFFVILENYRASGQSIHRQWSRPYFTSLDENIVNMLVNWFGEYISANMGYINHYQRSNLK